MLAFEKAIEAGCDGIELDVHLSKDGELVIIHDEELDRTTDGTGLVGSYTLAELKSFDASAAFAGIYGKNEIPTLREYFGLVKDTNIITNIELKTGVYTYPGIEEKALSMIDEFDLRSKIIISSFNHYSVTHFKELAPDMKCGFLTESWFIDMPAYTRKYGMEYVHPIFNAVTEDFVRQAAENGIGINTWTVNTREDMLDMLRKGVNSIIGNEPELARKVIEEYQAELEDQSRR